MKQPLQRLPLGIQDFKRLRENDMLYVDKTAYIYHLISDVSSAFLARPRRFGKSLLCSTLQYLFEGKRELFKGLWLDRQTEQLGFKWDSQPVIHLDMSIGSVDTVPDFTAAVVFQLEKYAEQYGIINLTASNTPLLFHKLIVNLAEETGKRVVVLIDEYDAPIVKRINRPKRELEAFKTFLRDFYGVLKGSNANLDFLLLTGITKFTKLSVFSALNNLQDISFQTDYASLLGYSQTELETYFSPHIQSIAHNRQQSKDRVLNDIKHWYNGYRFAKAEAHVSVYNPFSTLNYFRNRELNNYWFESGSPKLLMDLVQQQNYDVRNLNLVQCDEDLFMGFEPEAMTVESLFYYTGYLTLTAVRKVYDSYEYDLGFPNHEVKRSFYLYFIRYALPRGDQYQRVQIIKALRKALETASISGFKTVVRQYFSLLPYSIQTAKGARLVMKEHYYQSLLYALFYLASVRVVAEEWTNVGRADLVCELPGLLYIFELKIDQTAAAGLTQIKGQRYYEKYRGLDSAWKIYIGGLNFNTQERNIDEVVWEEVWTPLSNIILI